MQKIITIIFTTTLVILCIGLISELDAQSEFNENWYYDDYKDIDCISTEGSLEKITDSKGNNFVHAKSTGPGKYTDNKGTHTITVKKAKLDLIFLMGQSNAAYVSTNVSQANPVPEIGTSYYYTSHNNGKYDGIDISKGKIKPVVNINGECQTADKAPAICASYVKETNRKCLFVCGAIGGVSIWTYQPGGPSWNYAAEVLNHAINAVDLNNFDLTICPAFGWIQGEADKDRSENWYINEFNAMFDYIKTKGIADQKFNKVLVSLVTEEFAKNPRDAQITLSKNNPDVIISADANEFTVNDNRLTPGDPIHYSQLGDNEIGNKLGQSFGKITEKSLYPDNIGSNTKLIGQNFLIIITLLIIIVAIIYKKYN